MELFDITDDDIKYEDNSYLKGLNPEQIEAVQCLDGALLVLAGAGTGKTRVLTTRLAHLLKSNKCFPSQILAVTFTNKAAQEMKERVSSLMGGIAIEGWWLGTFHSLSARMLRQHANLVGLSSDFTILNSDDTVRLLKQLMENENIDTKKFPPKAMMTIIERWKDKCKTPDKINMNDAGDLANGKLPLLYRQYQQRLKEVNACDFGSLLLHMIEILKNPENKHILDSYHNRFRYIMVDEYQDTNVAQYMWLRLLAQGAGNICCVGDDDQSIYGWRGAEVGNILRFEKDFNNAKIIRLEQNYRSTSNILDAADSIISNNNGRLGKKLWSDKGQGEKLVVKSLWDGEAEARWVGEEIENLQHKQISLNQIAILVRTGFQMREFEERFISLGLPYKVIGGPRFYERAEIRDALAYLRVVNQPHDDLALERIINTPRRGIGNTTIKTLYEFGREKGISLYSSIIQLIETDELRAGVRKTLASLISDFDRWASLLETESHYELSARILDESGYMDMWKNDKSPDAPGRVENLNEMISAIAEYNSLPEFLEHVALVLEVQNDKQGDYATLMTLHGAKGLEFDYIFLPGWEDGLFPSQKSMDENGQKGLEEERRLAYVGITRARKKVFISFCSNRRMYGSWINPVPSRFINELPEEYIDSSSEIDNYQTGRSSHWDSSGFSPSYKNSSAGISVTAKDYQKKISSKSSHPFKPGTKIFHKKFGYGSVVHVEGHKLDIKFETSGNKRLVDSFVTPVE